MTGDAGGRFSRHVTAAKPMALYIFHVKDEDSVKRIQCAWINFIVKSATFSFGVSYEKSGRSQNGPVGFNAENDVADRLRGSHYFLFCLLI